MLDMCGGLLKIFGPVRKSFFLNLNMLQFHLCNCVIIVHVLKTFSIYMVSVPKRHDLSFLVFSFETLSRVGLCFPTARQHLAGSGVTLKLDSVAHFGRSKFKWFLP